MQQGLSVDYAGIPISVQKLEHSYNEIKLAPTDIQDIEGGEQFPLPNITIGRQITFVCAPSQAGKTTFVAEFGLMFKKMYELDNIYVFSEKAHDQLDILNPKRISLKPPIPTDPFLFKNSLIIFDDIDGIYDKDVRKDVFSLMERILKLGGECKCHIIITYHMMSNRNETRYLLFECNYIVLFPNTGSKNQFRNLLLNYVGLDSYQVEELMNMNSRWVFLHKNHPRYIVTQHETRIL